VSSDLFRLPSALRARLQRELRPRERVIYAAVPSPWRTLLPGLALSATGVFVSYFLYRFGWIAITTMLHESAAGRWFGTFLTLGSIPFVLVALGCLAAPLYLWLKARRTIHAVTSARLLTVVDAPWRTVESLRSEITSVRRLDRAGGTGHLLIGRGAARDAGGSAAEVSSGWWGIPDVKRAEEAARALVGVGDKET